MNAATAKSTQQAVANFGKRGSGLSMRRSYAVSE